MCFLACTTKGAVISELYSHKGWEMDLSQQCNTKKKLVIASEPCQTVEKAAFHPKKAILCILLNCIGPFYYKLLSMNKTINSEKYSVQLNILKAAIEEKRPGLANRHWVVFHQDNARPHVSVNTLQKLKGFVWDIPNDPPFSPDMAPLNYYLLRSMEHSLCGKIFTISKIIWTTSLHPSRRDFIEPT